MFSHFIWRGNKRKGNKAIESRFHQKSSSTSQSSRLEVASPFILDINDESVGAQNSPLGELTFAQSNEEWFPRELLRSRSHSRQSSLPAQNAPVVQESSTLETRVNSSPTPFLGYSENASSTIAFRKKSIPAPIFIPDVDYMMPKVQIGQSSVPSLPSVAPQPNTLNPPSPSVSDNLSSISGTTLARALIGSSFVLSSSERRSSRHKSGTARQDSATLPTHFFVSDSRSSSPIPPVPPVPTMLVKVSVDSNCPPTTKSGASTESEYPLSGSYITSPEMAIGSTIPRRISRIQEIPSPTIPASTTVTPFSVPVTRPQRKATPAPGGAPAPRNGVSDGPQTALERSLLRSQKTTQRSQEGSSSMSSNDHTLDLFDFVPPESLMVVASPGSDSSASYIVPTTLPPKRGDPVRGQRKQRVTGRDGCMIAKENSPLDGNPAFHQVDGMPSATTSEHDYGELFHYDLTLSPESSTSSASVSGGYQTFPETPVVFSPLWSSGYASILAKSDSQALRRRLSSLKSVGHGPGRLRSGLKTTRRLMGNNGEVSSSVLRRSQSSSLPKQKTPSPRQAEFLPSSAPIDEDGSVSDETKQSLVTGKVELQHLAKPLSAIRPHPLAHVPSSSSCLLEEEVLETLATHLSSSSPSIIVGRADSSSDSTKVSAPVTDPSVESPTSIPLPESTDVSPSNSPAFTNSSSTAFSPLGSPLQTSLSTSSTAISLSHPAKSLTQLSPSPKGSSFLSSPPLSTSLDESHSPLEAISSSAVSDGVVPHFPSPSFVPLPYHGVVPERTLHHSSSTLTPSLSRVPSTELLGHMRSRQPSNSSLASVSVLGRGRSRPPLPIGPRKPSGPSQVFGSFMPIRGRNGSASSVGSSDPVHNSALPWRKLHTAASRPLPKFHVPPPKWRGVTLEAAQWTFTSAQLQEIVSQAIRQTSAGSALRFLRPDILDGEVSDEMQQLEFQLLDVKSEYKALARKRWILMGALAGHVEGVETSDIMTGMRTVEELSEVLLGLDRLTDKMHYIVQQMAHLKSLRDVHNTSALAMAVRKINELFIRQMAEKERLQEEANALRTERDEAWKHAEEVAHDYDTLNDRMSENACDVKINADAVSATSSKRSTRISAVRKSNIWQSQAGLRSRSQRRSGRSFGSVTRPTSLALDDIPPVPRLPVNPLARSSGLPLSADKTTGSVYSNTSGTSAALALAEAQREVYEMLGLSLPPSQASSRRRTMSGPGTPELPSPAVRPVSETLGTRARRQRSCSERGRTRSVVLGDVNPLKPNF